MAYYSWLMYTRMIIGLAPRGLPGRLLKRLLNWCRKPLPLDDTLAEAHGLLGYLYIQKREYEKGIAEGERAVALNPGVATVLGSYARV